MIYFAIGLLVVAVVQAVQHRIESRSSEPKGRLPSSSRSSPSSVGVWSTFGVVMIGDAGAQAVWGTRE